jgi:hypothetical protein
VYRDVENLGWSNKGLPQSVSFLNSSFNSWHKTVLRNSFTVFRTYLTRASRDLSFMFVVYAFDLIVKVWFVFIVLTKFMVCSGDFLKRFSWFHFIYLSVFMLCTLLEVWVLGAGMSTLDAQTAVRRGSGAPSTDDPGAWQHLIVKLIHSFA